jgi:signal transduction histidine kinase/putative methionine-R-sulfoxide reductase with GAF domain
MRDVLESAQAGSPGSGDLPETELRSAAQLKMLQSLARQLNQLNDVPRIGAAIAEELRTLIDYHNCRVHLIDEEKGLLIPIAFRGALTEYQGETFDALLLSIGEGIAGRVALTGESYYTPNANDDPQAVTIPGTPDLDESIVAVALRYGDQIIGTVSLSKLGIDRFDDQDIQLLEVLASHAAVAIENARLLEREREAGAAARELLKISQVLTRVHTAEGVLTEALSSMSALVACSGVQAYLQDPRTGDFTMTAAKGEIEGLHRRLRVPADMAGRFLGSMEDPFVLSAEELADVPDVYRIIAVEGPLLVAPLRWEPNGAGGIVVLGREPEGFTEQDLQLARGIADVASLALGNAGRFRELEETADRLRALDQMKNTFLEAVSHELRTPLAAVLGIALTLQRTDVELQADDRCDLTDRLAANARKLDRLLSDLLDLDRLARGILEPNRQPTDLAALVHRCAQDSPLLAAGRLIVETDPVTASVDAAKVERIVENLLANSARHTPPGTSVWLRLHRENEGVLIQVDDEGPGVPAELRTAIFQPFQQGPNPQPHSPGVGIGLALVARFAELHGGRAWVQGRPGGGASFRVFIAGPKTGPA